MDTGFWSPFLTAFVVGLVSQYVQAKEPVVVQITATGASVIDGRTYATPEELKQALVEFKAETVYLRPERGVRYADVARVMKVIQELGLDAGWRGGTSQ